MRSTAHKIARAGTLSLALAFALVSFSATHATAENGSGNRNSGDRGNPGKSDAENSGNGNGRGHLSRELRGLNAAHANPNALANASPNSMPGKLYAYQQAQGSFVAVVEVQDDAYAEYLRLTGLTEEEITAEFPDGGYEDAVTNAAIVYEDARADAVVAQSIAQESLTVLTGGAELSGGALAELSRLLGL